MKVFATNKASGSSAKYPETTRADAYRQRLFGNAGRNGPLGNKTIGQLLGNRSASGNPLRRG
jgi:hypothetical protein